MNQKQESNKRGCTLMNFWSENKVSLNVLSSRRRSCSAISLASRAGEFTSLQIGHGSEKGEKNVFDELQRNLVLDLFA